MNVRVTMATLLVAGALTGCASTVPIVDFYEADSGTLRQFQSIEVLDDESTHAKNLGEVEGIYCKRLPDQVSADHPFAEAQAIDQVKLKAAAKGANYITAPRCVGSDSADFANNCYTTLVCTSTALKH